MANLTVGIMNSLSCYASNLLDPKNGIRLTVSEAIFCPGMQVKSKGESTYSTYDTLSDTPHAGSMKRPVCSLKEFCDRFSDVRWNFKSDKITLSHDSQKIEMWGEFTIIACPGTASENSRQWLANVRDGQEYGKGFRKGAGAGQGARPTFLSYLYASVIDNGEPIFERFSDNAVFAAYSPRTIFNGLGVRYNESKSSPSIKSPKPFAIVMFKITKLGNLITEDEKKPCSPIYFSNIMGRRPDFLFERQVSNDILNLAAIASSSYVPQEMKDWFNNHFPRNDQDRVPITLNGDSPTRINEGDCLVYDVRTGKKFDRVFNADNDRVLAVFSPQQNKFLSDLTVSSSTKGVDIDKIVDVKQALKFSDFKNGYMALQKEKKIDIHLFTVSITPLQKKLDDEWQNIPVEEYEHGSPLCRPSRGVYAITELGRIMLGSIDEVPKVQRQQQEGGKKEPGEAKSKSKASIYTQRDARIAVRFDENDQLLYINENYPLFAKYYIVPDEPGSKTTKLLSELYLNLSTIALGVWDGVKNPVRVDVASVLNLNLDDDDRPIYEENRSDWVLNKTIIKYLADSQDVRELLQAVDKVRTKI